MLERGSQPQQHVDSEDYRETKEQINQEGPIGNDGGDELYIGTREEIDKAKAKNENEGRTKDVKAYIENNSDVVASKEELTQMIVEDKKLPGFIVNAAQNIIDGKYKKGSCDLFMDSRESGVLTFINNEGQLSQVKLEFKKIDDMKNVDPMNMEEKALEYLKVLTFAPHKDMVEIARVATTVNNFKEKKREEKKKIEDEQNFKF